MRRQRKFNSTGKKTRTFIESLLHIEHIFTLQDQIDTEVLKLREKKKNNNYIRLGSEIIVL